MSRSLRYVPILAALALVLGACSTAGSTGTAGVGSPMPMASDDHAEGGFAWGEPAVAGEADRVVDITMLDELRFEPASVEIAVGETVTFRITNAGKLPHDFTLGDEATQVEHDAEMAEGEMPGMGQHDPNALTLDAGMSGELTWRFTAPASILYGCHIPGHYDAGMVGMLTIAES